MFPKVVKDKNSPVSDDSNPQAFSNSSSDTLNDIDESFNWMQPAKPPKKTYFDLSSSLYNILLGTLVILIIFAGIQLNSKRVNIHAAQFPKPLLNETEEKPCGSSANSAREAGCIFDPITFSWLPPACYDWDLTSEFLALKNWEYYRQREDGSLRQISLINIMQSSDEVVYTSWEFHRQECTYLWLKMHRAMMGRNPIDGVSMWEINAEECLDIVRSDREDDDMGVAKHVKFPSCKMY